MTEQQNTRPSATPGNTDPIAKYDDELRKVQGGWRDMDSAPKGPTEINFYDLAWGDPEDVCVGPGIRHKDKYFSVGVYYRGGPASGRQYHFKELEVQPFAWKPSFPPPTEHPTEQPSVRDAAHSLVALNQDGEVSAMMDITNMKLTDVLCTLDGWHPDFVTLTIMPRAAALRSLAQEGE